MIKYGLKLWSSNNPLIFKEAVDLVWDKQFDFVELYIVPGTFDANRFSIFKTIPMTLHATHTSHGANLAQVNEINAKAHTEVTKFADFLSASQIVVHPGHGTSLETVITHLKKLNDTRFLIENMPYRVLQHKDETCVGVTADEIRQLLPFCSGLCFDFGHAVKACVSKSLDYKEFSREFFAFSPTYFHITDGTNSEFDDHLKLGTGIYDLKWIKSEIENVEGEVRVVFETPKEGNSLESDIQNKNYYLNL